MNLFNVLSKQSLTVTMTIRIEVEQSSVVTVVFSRFFVGVYEYTVTLGSVETKQR